MKKFMDTKEVLNKFKRESNETTVDVMSDDDKFYSFRVKTGCTISERLSLANEIAELCVREDGTRFIGIEGAATVMALFDECIAHDEDEEISVDCADAIASSTDFIQNVVRESFGIEPEKFYDTVEKLIEQKVTGTHKKVDALLDSIQSLVSKVSDEFGSVDLNELSNLAKKLSGIDDSAIVNAVIDDNAKRGTFMPENVIVNNSKDEERHE